MSPNKTTDEESEEKYDEDEELQEEEEYICRVCKKEFTHDDGDDNLMICDPCAEKYDIEKIWDDYEADKITLPELTKIDLSKYKL